MGSGSYLPDFIIFEFSLEEMKNPLIMD